jgi:hypothetical protein
LPLVEQAVSANQSHVKCRGIKDVLVSALAPDVALSEFNGARVEYKDIQVIKQIGEGGFAKVYKAVWNGEIIALKQLTLDTSSTVESLGFEFEDAVNPLDVFKEFRAEVLLMRYTPPSQWCQPSPAGLSARTHARTHATRPTDRLARSFDLWSHLAVTWCTPTLWAFAVCA